MRALIYLRVSTGDQAHKELPIDTQREACLRLAKQKGYLVDLNEDIYVDTESGRSMHGRTALQLLLERCKSDRAVKAVIIYDISRLSRNAVEYQMMKSLFQKNGIELISNNEPLVNDGSAASWILEHILSGFAEFRSRQDGEKIRNSLKNKVMNGGFCGYAPYGYKNVQEATSSNKSKRWIEPNELEAPWVRRCHELFSTGEYPINELIGKLEEEGMRPRYGNKLQTSFIHRILREELYIGIIQWGGVRNENGIHQHLVDKEIFYKNQEILDARRLGATRRSIHLFLLRPVAICGECGSHWTAGYHKNGKGTQYGLYSCYKRQKNQYVRCLQSSVSIDVLEKQFETIFRKVQLSNSAVEKLRDRVRKYTARDEETFEKIYLTLSTKLENNKISQKRLLQKFIENIISDELYSETQKNFEKEEVDLKKEISRAETKLKASRRVVEMALTLANNCYRAYQKAPTDELKALLIQAIFKKLVIQDKEIRHAELTSPFYFIAEQKISMMPVFHEAYAGGDGGS